MTLGVANYTRGSWPGVANYTLVKIGPPTHFYFCILIFFFFLPRFVLTWAIF